jgi:trans-aconitate 2-methyltransferase
VAVPREWDAAAYDALPLPHERWGTGVVERLQLNGDEHVLDVGCGTGRDTALLLARLPHGRVTAVDASSAMLHRLRERLGADLDRVDVVRADVSLPLPVTDPVDAVMSVAALHWVGDHAAAFAHLRAVMRPGGQLVAECGGRGNVAAVIDAVRRGTGDDSTSVGWNFAAAGETERRLLDAGFVDVHVALQEDPVRLEPGRPLRDFLRTVVLGGHLDRRDPSEHDAFVDAVADAMAQPVVDYVRLRIQARRR